MTGDALRDLLIWILALLFAAWAYWVTIGGGGWRFVAAAPVGKRATYFAVLVAADLLMAYVAILTRPS